MFGQVMVTQSVCRANPLVLLSPPTTSKRDFLPSSRQVVLYTCPDVVMIVNHEKEEGETVVSSRPQDVERDSETPPISLEHQQAPEREFEPPPPPYPANGSFGTSIGYVDS